MEAQVRPVRRRRRSEIVALGVTAVMAASSLAACGSDDEPEYAGVCVDPQTQVRHDDDQCRCLDPETGEWNDDDGDCRSRSHTRNHVGWYFIPYGLLAAGVGSRVAGGSFSRPDRSYSAGGVPRTGGTVNRSSVKGGTTINRGGFGSRGGGVGG